MREVLRLEASLGDDVERDADARADARRDHAQGQRRVGALGDDAHRLHRALAAIRAQPQRDEVERLGDVRVDGRLDRGRDVVRMALQPLAEGAGVGRAQRHRLVGTDHRLRDDLHLPWTRRAVGSGRRGGLGSAAGEAASVAAAVGRRRDHPGLRARIERGEERVVRQLQLRAGAHRQHPCELGRVAAVADLIPEHRLRLRDGERHPVIGDDGSLGLLHEATTARVRAAGIEERDARHQTRQRKATKQRRLHRVAHFATCVPCVAQASGWCFDPEKQAFSSMRRRHAVGHSPGRARHGRHTRPSAALAMHYPPRP